MIDLHSKIHSSTQVAEGAGISPATLRGYYLRGKFRELTGDHRDFRERAEKGGQPNRYNARGAMHVALAVELIRYGFDGDVAFDTALSILVAGGGRQPGGCYNPRNGETLFCATRGLVGGHVISRDDLARERIMLDEFGSVLVISLNQIEARVFAALGIEGHSWDDVPDGEFDSETGEWAEA